MSEELDQFSVASVYAELLSRAPENKMEPRMQPMIDAMDLLGEPNKTAPVIHITGTNGKTSTARMIEAGLLAHDLRVGRYTSPHLNSVTERICLDGQPVEDATFVRIWDEVRPFISLVDDKLAERGEVPLTYFECVTILAFAVFADAPVDVMVLEVGLGGITDATNVADGSVSVITPISLDHTDLLGDDERDIALEKAGIIKTDGFLISAAQVPAAADVLLAEAREKNVAYRFEGVEFGVESRVPGVGGQQLSVTGLAGRYPDILLPLHGAHQAQNFAVAVAALEAFIGGGDQELNIENLRLAAEHISAPGRLETLRTGPSIIVDAAHNPAGVTASAQALKESFGLSRLVLVVGILQDKDAREMLTALYKEYEGLVEDICFTQSTSPRAIPAGQLGSLALDVGYAEQDIYVTERLDDAIDWAVGRADEADPGLIGGVLITGSITLVGEARTLLGAPEGT
ncbi:bifunctional folylpolyglutamate synthase/dihydrofolate synthase [Nesterenkonia sp. E16_7]|uniref:bifunctional folylpolyglutamate synthase/dihydrofolate synthase n=1 Tax=unclassified Nesterenkonia TaxID=2629769 RepID=UPI001A92489E|nr:MULTISPECIES: folylpolyglutamate synthase/dihydrofolate synthase family protein [unclassified Nesterenkonia]MBO0596129.1 bifunctional folylpolyglutamate synthase/dihydrofolate synthase [Nesterenkonia sp. E16_10]MBO0599267.1 bifunctional folylpolyglutamate synthase/dihydrofolate synthase [Nesterenkonia sp. E16_7]